MLCSLITRANFNTRSLQRWTNSAMPKRSMSRLLVNPSSRSTSTSTHSPHNDQTRMYPDPYSKLNTFVSLQLFIQVFYRREDTQASPYCSLGVIFMGVGIPKVDQETIP